MGCDIHLHIEVKLNGKWHHYGLPDIDRWYDLFAKMANVRNRGEITPISEPKGIPEDITELTRFDYEHWESDGHSHSWLSSKEIVMLEDWLNELQEEYQKEHPESWREFDLEMNILHTYFFGNSFAGFERYKKECESPIGIEDVRFVFWFDC